MRVVDIAAISILAVSLVAGPAVGATGQDEPTAGGVTSFTGTFTSQLDIVSEGTVTTADGLEDTEGLVVLTSIVSSDPRLTGTVTYTGNWLIDLNGEMTADGLGNSLRAGTYEVTNDNGSWLGEARAFGNFDLGVNSEAIVFVGRGGYEGFTAYAVVDHVPWPSEFVGTIFPSAMPEVPEPYAVE